ncbi:MAG: GntR family transcriptional regulator [Sneathiella sp.]
MSEHFNWNFSLSQTDERAMYQQIMDHIKQHVVLGDLPEGAKLPSMRELSSTLKVSMITIKRAYLELERAGTIIIQHGKGAWVGNGLDLYQVRQGELEQQLKNIAELATAMKIPEEDLMDRLKKYTKD